MGTSGTLKTVMIVAFTLVVLFTIAPRFTAKDSYAVQVPQESGAAEQFPGAQALSLAFESVAEMIQPSVVNISSVKR